MSETARRVYRGAWLADMPVTGNRVVFVVFTRLANPVTCSVRVAVQPLQSRYDAMAVLLFLRRLTEPVTWVHRLTLPATDG